MNKSPDLEYLLENLLTNTSDSIYFKDAQSRFVLVNQACAVKHGWDSEKIKGKTDFDTFSKDHAERAYADERRIIETGEPLFSIEERETWPDGRVTWVSTTKMPIRDDNGEIIGLFGITRDITDRKRAATRVRLYAEEVNTIKEEMENDVRMAGKLQKNFMPTSYPAFPAGAAPADQHIEFLHRFNLNRQVSGDYCAVTRVSDHEAGIFLCDVQGVGVRAALGTALVRGVVQEIQGLAADPAAYLGRMNAMLSPLLRKEGMLLDVSACYFTLDARTGAIRLASAGHTMPIHFRDGYAAQWLCDGAACAGPPLGVDPAAGYVAIEQTISADDSVVAFTDGLYTVRNNMDDAYGKKRLLDSAHSLAGESLADVFSGLEGDALAFSKTGKFSDDVCLVGFHLKTLMP